MLSILLLFPFHFNVNFANFTTIFFSASPDVNRSFSVECFLNVGHIISSIFYYKIIVSLTFPIVLLILILILRQIMKYLRKKIKEK